MNERTVQLLSLDQALSRLAEREPRQAKVAELRCFCDLGVEEIAAMPGISLATTKRELQTAQAIL